MALPENIRVKLSSEEAGFVSITPVVAREMPVRELVELMLGIAGKEPGRIHELLLRGTLVSGGSRFRWKGWEADREVLRALLATFPDPEPSRPFAGEHCVRAILRGPGVRVEISREAGARKRLFRDKNYWDVLMGIASSEGPRYADYSYREHADCYRISISPSIGERLKECAGMLKYPALANQIRTAPIETLELFTERTTN